MMKKCKLCDRIDIKSKKLRLCSIHYARWYRKHNKDKIKPVAQARYLRNRERRLQKSREWAKNNPERVREYGRKRWHKNNKLNRIRQLTKFHFNGLKKKSTCENCGSKERLEFHHLEPWAYDNFIILCFNCHRVLHGQLFEQFAKTQSQAVFESEEVKKDG